MSFQGLKQLKSFEVWRLDTQDRYIDSAKFAAHSLKREKSLYIFPVIVLFIFK